MKKIILLFYLLIGLKSQAQQIFIQGGFSLSRIPINSVNTNPWSADIKPKQGFVAGLGFESSVKGRFNWLSGFYFSQKGWRSDNTAYDSEIEAHLGENFNVRVNYLETPLLAKFNIISGELINLHVKSGFHLAMFMNGTFGYAYSVDYNNGNPVSGNSYTVKIIYENGRAGNEYLENRFDAGFRLGVGVQLKDKLSVDLDFSQGLIRNSWWDSHRFPYQTMQLTAATSIFKFTKTSSL